MNDEIIKQLQELKKSKERKFNQSVDFILNLKNFDVRKQALNLFVFLPHPIGERKVCGFLQKKSDLVETITKDQFDSFKDKKDLKKLVKEYDFFIASAPLMASIATKFGRYLGPAGKMPSPQLGIVPQETNENVQNLINKFKGAVRIRSKESSVKFSVGKIDMKAEDLADNIMHAFKIISAALPRQKDNIKSFMIKLTMSKPIRIKWQ